MIKTSKQDKNESAIAQLLDKLIYFGGVFCASVIHNIHVYVLTATSVGSPIFPIGIKHVHIYIQYAYA